MIDVRYFRKDECPKVDWCRINGIGKYLKADDWLLTGQVSRADLALMYTPTDHNKVLFWQEESSRSIFKPQEGSCHFITEIGKFLYAHAGPANKHPVLLLNLAQVQYEDEEEDDTSPEIPPDMKLTPPKFNLSRIRTTSIAQKSTLELQLTSAVLSDSALTDGETDAQSISNTLFFNEARLRANRKLGSSTQLAADIGGSFARF